ncbi:hypothetical protein L6Q21_09705 [Sandaracinobacter sp. RS1-74]|nr:hypothetical protein [Sandaracinobacteroides sayramensis]
MLSALIRFSDGKPRPPERFRRKLALWQQTNGEGRLVQKVPERAFSPPSEFALRMGDFSSEGVVVMMSNITWRIDCTLHFEIVEEPAPGMVRVLTSFTGNDELLHLAPDMASAQAWMARNAHGGLRLEIVGETPSEGRDAA